MPTLGDTPILEKLEGDSLLSSDSDAFNKIARNDMLSFYDESTGKIKTITVKELGESLGLTFS
tara:strand:+ start:944 stop:1132 length:189 start_codon:yes stop_codon:yes gene_type:complete